jgi:hypothetical protein
MKWIDKSKKEKEFWIPAIAYMNELFTDNGIKSLSDGEKETLIN